MTPNEQFAALQEQFVSGMTADPRLSWFADANVLISGDATRLLARRAEVLTTQGVVGEVRKRPLSQAANAFVDRIVQQNGVVGRDFFAGAPGYDLLLSCAMMLAPVVQFHKNELAAAGVPPDEAEKRVLERAANEGSFFEGRLLEESSPGRGDEVITRVDKSSRRSWFKYPKKRREREGTAEGYAYSDETLLATALASSLLSGRRACVLSNDTDCAAIMKQLSDNLVWASAKAECGAGADFDTVVACFEARCRDLNEFRSAAALEVLDVDPDVAPWWAVAGRADQLVIHRTSDGRTANYSFSPELAEFVRGFR